MGSAPKDRTRSAARRKSSEASADSGMNLSAGRRVSVAMTVWLVIVWTFMYPAFSWLVLISGVIFAVLIQLIFPMPSHRNMWHFRIAFVVPLVLRFVWDLVRAGVQVSGVVLSGRPHEDGIVECRTRSSNPVYMTIVAAMCSMIPGTIVLKVQKNVMYLHALNLPGQGGPEGVRESVAGQEKRVLLAMATDAAVVDAGYGNYLSSFARKRITKAKEVSE